MAKYSGDRSHEDLKRFIAEQLGEESKEDTKEEPEDSASSVVILTGEKFDAAIAKGITFVKFFAPWCGHCKRLAPTFEELAKKFSDIDSITIAKVDCTQQENKELCSQQKVLACI